MPSSTPLASDLDTAASRGPTGFAAPKVENVALHPLTSRSRARRACPLEAIGVKLLEAGCKPTFIPSGLVLNLMFNRVERSARAVRGTSKH